MQLTFTELVKRRQINCSPGRTIVFPRNHHAEAPVRRLAVGHALKNAKSHIPLEVSLYLFLPVEWYRGWFTQ